MVQFVPGGQKVISGSDDGAIRLFDRNTGNLLKTLTGQNNQLVMSLGISKDGKRLLSGGYDLTTRIWDLEKGVELRRMQHGKGVQHAALSLDGKRAVTTCLDNTVQVWDADTGKLLHALTHPGMVWRVAISPDGRRVYTGCGGGPWNNGLAIPPNLTNSQIRVFDLNTGKELRMLAGHSNYVMGVVASADGRFLASCS